MAPTTTTYTISHLAYLKMILHTAKHPGQVNGVLLGQKNGSEVEVSDVIPLLHHWTTLSPMMEIGLDLARSNAEERQLKLVGYYQATDRPDDERVFYPVGEKVASTVLENFDAAFALVIDGTASIGSIVPYLPSSTTSKDPTWTAQPRVVFSLPSSSTDAAESASASSSPSSPFRLAEPDRSPGAALTAIREQNLHAQFGDFDDHLEDVTIDWLRNPSIAHLS